MSFILKKFLFFSIFLFIWDVESLESLDLEELLYGEKKLNFNLTDTLDLTEGDFCFLCRQTEKSKKETVLNSLRTITDKLLESQNVRMGISLSRDKTCGKKQNKIFEQKNDFQEFLESKKPLSYKELEDVRDQPYELFLNVCLKW